MVDDDHSVKVEAVAGWENIVLEVYCRPENVGLSIGVPCSRGTDPHGTTHVAAVSGLEKPLPAAVTGVVLDTDASATAGEGVAHA